MSNLLSFSQAAELNKCGRAYGFGYIEGLKKKKDNHYSKLGTIFHDALEVYIRNLPVEEVATKEQINKARIAANNHASNACYPLINNEEINMGHLHSIHEGLRWYPPALGIGTRYAPIKLQGDYALELELEYNGWRGKADAVMLDLEYGYHVMFDWKWRSRMPNLYDLEVDTQTTLYGYLLVKQYGILIDKAVMVNFDSKTPNHFQLVKSGAPTTDKRILGRTTPEVWYSTVPEGYKINAFPDMSEHMADFSKFILQCEYVINDEVFNQLEHNLEATEALRDYYQQLYDEGKPLPALMHQKNCGWCDFKALCGAIMKGGDIDYLLETEYTFKDGYEEDEEEE